MESNAAHYNCANNKIVLVQSAKLADSAVHPKNDYDQLIYFTQPEIVARKRMEMNVKIYNKDGSEAGNCLNGMRALADLAFTQLGIRKKITFVQDGLILAESFRDNVRAGVVVDRPLYKKGTGRHPDKLDVGNQHFVHWPKSQRVEKPRNYVPKVNEEYVLWRNKTALGVVVYEAGVGETPSCGSGGVSVVESAFQKYPEEGNEWSIHFLGGTLYAKIGKLKTFLSGPVKRVG